jgi:hypothetical protein
MDVSVTPPADANLLPVERPNIAVAAGKAAALDVALAGGGVVKGFVVSPRDARMAGVQVTLNVVAPQRRTGWAPQLQPVTTQEDGTFRFVGLAPGTYQLGAQAYDGKHVFFSEQVVDVVAGKEVERTLAARTGAFIELTLTGPDGKPAANVSGRAESRTKGASHVYAKSDATGAMTLGPLVAGTYDVKVLASRDRDRMLKPAEVNEVTVKEGERVSRKLTLEEGPPPPPPGPARR